MNRYSVTELAWAVTMAGRHIPDATCLTQALAIHALLTQAGHRARVEIGVAKESRFEAHAWVTCNGSVVLGATESALYHPILAWE
jgi:hypothetical protein